MNVQTIRCTGCGAEVSLAGSTTHAVCAHCGGRVWLEEKLRHARDEALALEAFAAATKADLERAIRAELVLWARTRAVGLGVVVAAPAFLAALVEYYAAEYFERLALVLVKSVIVTDIALAAAVGAVAWFWFGEASRIEAGVRGRLAAFQEHIAREPPGGQCPSCGAQVVAPAPLASFACRHCHAPLVLAWGVLRPWVQSSKEHVRRHKWQAFGIQLEADVWPGRTWLAFALALVLFSIGLRACLTLAVELMP